MSKMEVLARMNLLDCAACSVLNHISLGMSGAVRHTNCVIGSNTVTCRRAALSPKSAQRTARLSHSVSAIGASGMRTGDAAAGCARRSTQTYTGKIRCTSGNTVALGLFSSLVALGGPTRDGARGSWALWVGGGPMLFPLNYTKGTARNPP